MLKFAAVAVFGALSALGATRALGGNDTSSGAAPQLRPATSFSSSSEPSAAVREPESRVASQAYGDASITKGPDGHYWAEADVNSRRVRFLVDTGATEVALTGADARRLGFEPRDLTYAYKVSTASGDALAARVHLDSVSVAGARVRNVDALVIDHGLDISLLGMTYLGRLSRFEATPQALILRP
jgi:aspartyl protease family protein